MYEQLLYYYYDRFLSGRDPQYLVWATAKALQVRRSRRFMSALGRGFGGVRGLGRLPE